MNTFARALGWFMLSFCVARAASAQAGSAAPPPAAGPTTAIATGATPEQPAVLSVTPSPQPQPTAAAAAGPATPSNEEILASPEVIEKAKQHFKQGVAFAASGNCDGAVVEFEAAYHIIPRPNALYNIAQCEERLFRYDLAISYYERYLKEARADAEDRPAVEAALKTLGNLLGVLHLKSNVKAEVWIDDRLGGQAPGDVYVPAGGHSVEVRAEGFLPKRLEVRLVGHEEVSVAVTLEKAQTTVNLTETTGISPTLFWIGASASLISASVGTAFALHDNSLNDQVNQTSKLSPERTRLHGKMQGAELTADVFFGTAVVLAIGTTIVAFMTEWTERPHTKPTDQTAPPSAAELHLTPIAAPGYAGLSMHGGL